MMLSEENTLINIVIQYYNYHNIYFWWYLKGEDKVNYIYFYIAHEYQKDTFLICATTKNWVNATFSTILYTNHYIKTVLYLCISYLSVSSRCNYTSWNGFIHHVAQQNIPDFWCPECF